MYTYFKSGYLYQFLKSNLNYGISVERRGDILHVEVCTHCFGPLFIEKHSVLQPSIFFPPFISASYLPGDPLFLEFFTLPEFTDLMCDLPVDAAVAGATVLCAHAGPTYTTPFPLLPHRILWHGVESCMLVLSLDVLAERRLHARPPGSEEHSGVLVIQGEFEYVWWWGSEPIPELVHAGKSSLLQPGDWWSVVYKEFKRVQEGHHGTEESIQSVVKVQVCGV